MISRRKAILGLTAAAAAPVLAGAGVKATADVPLQEITILIECEPIDIDTIAGLYGLVRRPSESDAMLAARVCDLIMERALVWNQGIAIP
jgi:hypothetical protein